MLWAESAELCKFMPTILFIPYISAGKLYDHLLLVVHRISMWDLVPGSRVHNMLFSATTTRVQGHDMCRHGFLRSCTELFLIFSSTPSPNLPVSIQPEAAQAASCMQLWLLPSAPITAPSYQAPQGERLLGPLAPACDLAPCAVGAAH